MFTCIHWSIVEHLFCVRYSAGYDWKVGMNWKQYSASLTEYRGAHVSSEMGRACFKEAAVGWTAFELVPEG